MGNNQFQISTRNSGRKRTIQVCVYDSVDELRQEGIKHSLHYESGSEGMERVHGLTQSYEAYDISKGGKTIRKAPAGFIRLYKNGLRTGIIAHEATHMAWAIYKQDVQKTIPDMEREEKLCYLVGDITRQIVNKLYKYNLIPEAK